MAEGCDAIIQGVCKKPRQDLPQASKQAPSSTQIMENAKYGPGPRQHFSRSREDHQAIGQSRALLGAQPELKSFTLQRRETEALASASPIENEADGSMAKATAAIVEKLSLPIHPFTSTQIPTAMKAPPAM